jgi:hypothetical protein
MTGSQVGEHIRGRHAAVLAGEAAVATRCFGGVAGRISDCLSEAMRPKTPSLDGTRGDDAQSGSSGGDWKDWRCDSGVTQLRDG